MKNPARRGLQALAPRLFGSVKAAPPQQAINAGYQTLLGNASLRSPAAASTQKLTNLMGTYGSPDDGVTWVYACTQTIMSELASYPYDILTLGDRVLPVGAIPPDLKTLLDEPNEDMTYGDFIEYKAMDEELAGNSYWLMDQMNGLGQPEALRRLRPEYTKIAVDSSGRILGYAYQPPGFSIPVPYNVTEILHFKRPNPLSPYYGMGTVEAIQRSIRSDLAETDHVIGFFSDGARISGILTTKTLSEVQFERFKEQFYEEYAGDANAHKILIAEEGTKFDPVTATAENSGVIELKAMSKDEILAGFGVPSPLLGGTWESADHSISNAMYIFSRKMLPRARRTSERVSLRLVARWSLKYRLNATYAEPKDSKVERSGKMLSGGASINESRAEMDLAPWPEEWADTPVIPQGVAPFGYMTSGGAPSGTPVNGAGDGSNGNQPQAESGQQQRALPAADVKSVAAVHHTKMVGFGTDLLTEVLSGYLVEQRERISKRVGGLKQKKPNLTVWIDDQERSVFTRAYTEAMETIVSDASRCSLYDLPGDDPVLREVVNGPLAIRAAAWMNEETQNTIEDAIELGIRRSYSVDQVVLGYPQEGYDGIVKAFDDAQARIPAMARAEVVTAVNLAMLRGYKSAGFGHVEVLDGDCPGDHGAIWLIEDALRKPIGHESCDRCFAPVV